MAWKCEEVGVGSYLFGFWSCRSRNGDDVDVAVIPAFLDQTEMPLKCNDFLALQSPHNCFQHMCCKRLKMMPLRYDVMMANTQPRHRQGRSQAQWLATNETGLPMQSKQTNQMGHGDKWKLEVARVSCRKK